ncbi:membrane protein UL45 [Equid alphaherpesvirus 3]|uniref:Membrane protein UL45 n=1 Tax=Equid alphaherpesvirus 3 TaxID=80341 RepID=A0A077B9A2_9ALPH|nr:membrane protein UL45 [Equid alphaherpesvirus 3]AIL02932.1 membrane protein UL45 [Equid alphaherpesvirus 3]
MAGDPTASLPPLEELERRIGIDNGSGGNKVAQTAAAPARRERRLGRCHCCCFTTGVFVAGVLAATAVLVGTFVLSVPLAALRADRCPPHTFGVGEACVRPVYQQADDYANLVELCARHSELPAAPDTMLSLVRLLSHFTADRGEFLQTPSGENLSRIAECIFSPSEACRNQRLGVCQAARPLSPLGKLVAGTKQALGLGRYVA